MSSSGTGFLSHHLCSLDEASFSHHLNCGVSANEPYSKLCAGLILCATYPSSCLSPCWCLAGCCGSLDLTRTMGSSSCCLGGGGRCLLKRVAPFHRELLLSGLESRLPVGRDFKDHNGPLASTSFTVGLTGVCRLPTFSLRCVGAWDFFMVGIL